MHLSDFSWRVKSNQIACFNSIDSYQNNYSVSEHEYLVFATWLDL